MSLINKDHVVKQENQCQMYKCISWCTLSKSNMYSSGLGHCPISNLGDESSSFPSIFRIPELIWDLASMLGTELYRTATYSRTDCVVSSNETRDSYPVPLGHSG